MNAEIKLWMAQIEMAKMAAAGIQVGQLSTSKDMMALVDNLNASIKALQDRIALEQQKIEMSK